MPGGGGGGRGGKFQGQNYHLAKRQQERSQYIEEKVPGGGGRGGE